MVVHCMCIPHFVYPSVCCWTFGVFPPFISCEQHYRGRWCTNIRSSPCCRFFSAYTQKWDCWIGRVGHSLQRCTGFRPLCALTNTVISSVVFWRWGCDRSHPNGCDTASRCGFDLCTLTFALVMFVRGQRQELSRLPHVALFERHQNTRDSAWVNGVRLCSRL